MNFLPTRWSPRLSSTNAALLERMAKGEDIPEGYVLVARQQTGGRGRYSRRWIAQPGRDLTFSFVLRRRVEPARLALLPMATALGVAVVLEGLGLAVQTKWPNDLLVNGQKICGILAESGVGDGVVVGVGLNVNMDAAHAAQIGRPVTSLYIETKQPYPIEQILDYLLGALPVWLERALGGGFAALRQPWESRCAQLGQWIAVDDGRQSLAGILTGFGSGGQLLLRGRDGVEHEVWAGDVDS
ncbi:MAG: biotin--[acetyl-CoA-carboxylase] ligase [Candidatus Latescibacteria bacterium]|nr:biotin--[acetyl-CoA-carboxylase] ligase [Candidatus Latescibacterota bacterium]